MTTSLIVGATGELGSVIARVLAERGDEVYVHGYQNRARLETLAKEVGAHNSYLVDVTDEVAVSTMFAEFDSLDSLILCAAINPSVDKLSDIPADTWRSVLDVNVTGTFLCLKYAIPRLRRSSMASVVLVSSIFGLQTPSRRAAYGASKHALNGLVQCLTQEEGSWLRVNAICPGPMWSENLRRIVVKHSSAEGLSLEEYVLKRVGDVPAGRLMELRECAEVVGFLTSTQAAFVRGESLRISGGAVQ